ncbi:MAG: DUF5689 domain-containing protein [Bacteroidales bacterium]|nr:DUF5689 domain-containing protein [Bacteroidales bacterium]
MKNSRKILTLLLFAGLISGMFGCIKDKPDAPPNTTIPFDPQKVYTIENLKQMYADSTEAFEITDIYSVFATVVMDESSGNIYKSAYIEDNTGGIQINFFYPGGLYLGDSIRILLKGAKIDNYHNLYQVQNLDVGRNIYKIKNKQYIEPELTTIPQLGTVDYYQSRPIRLENVQFAESEIGNTWADSVNKIDDNRYLEDCEGNSIIIRTSGYANFAGRPIPEGNGSLIAIASVYNSDAQLVIRDILEVNLDGERCNPGGEQQLLTISELRNLYSGSTTILPDSIKIQGVFISDNSAENISGKNAFINDEDGTGINLRFTDYHDFLLGDEIEINVSGLILDDYNGLMQLQDIPLSKIKFLGAVTPPAPLERTIQEVVSNFNDYEAILVLIKNVTLSGNGGIWSGNVNMNDGTGDLVHYTYDWASFAGELYPTYTVDITGIVGKYNSPQITIRNLDDVVESGGGGGPVTSINQDFSSQSNGADINLNGWLNTAETGTRLWQGLDLSGNMCAQAKSLGSGGDNTIWLITPPIDFDAISNPVFEFESAQQAWLHDGLTIWISTDFDGTNVTGATWIEIDCTIAGQFDPWNTWIPSGTINLSSYSGTGYIGFKYTGSDGAQSTPYMVDNVKLYNQ